MSQDSDITVVDLSTAKVSPADVHALEMEHVKATEEHVRATEKVHIVVSPLWS